MIASSKRPPAARRAPRRAALTLACIAVALVALTAAPVAGASAARSAASEYRSVGTPEQIAWVRRAARNFVTAELAADGAGACSILNAPLRAGSHGRTCAQRLSSRFSAALRRPGARSRLHAQLRAISSAAVIVHANHASLELAAPLLNGPDNEFLWTENCWMLEG